MTGCTSTLILSTFLLFNLDISTQFTIKMEKWDISPFPPMNVEIEPLEIQQNDIYNVTVPSVLLEGIISRIHMLEMALDSDINFKNMTPTADDVTPFRG